VCGIAGFVTNENVPVDLDERLAAMSARMIHRGPDDSGLVMSPDRRITLINRRLAIRDLSPTGHMPMRNQAGTVYVTQNGEIYNAQDLRRELESVGHRFLSTSDTEVILHGYEHWGLGVLDRLQGMYAVAIWDGRTDTPQVLLIRDRLGIKPLYYARALGGLIFASEVQALRAFGLDSEQINPQAVGAFLRLGTVPDPYTILQDVTLLLPGHYLLWRGGEMSVECYWSLPQEPATGTEKHLRDIIEELYTRLLRTVKDHLVSDVPIGAFLSGGLDSSAVVAMIRQARAEQLRTCSIVFEETELSEQKFSSAVAEHFQTDHYARVVTDQELQSAIPTIIACMDQPTVDGINTYFVSETAVQAGLRVAMSGTGGDELFGGYPNVFRQTPKVHRLLRIARQLPLSAHVARIATSHVHISDNVEKLVDVLDNNGARSLIAAYVARRSVFSRTDVERLTQGTAQFDPVAHILHNTRDSQDSDVFNWLSRAELLNYTNNQLVRDTDVMSMAHSLEVRVPFLDHQMVDFVLHLPTRYKNLPSAYPKPLLREAVQHLLPAAVTGRRQKQGFTFPFDRWLRTSMSRWASDSLKQMPSGLGISQPEVDRIWKLFLDSAIHWSRPWALLTLSAWMQVHHLE
jgi:asparagine synthase (glutamine-hydrolysing)